MEKKLNEKKKEWKMKSKEMYLFLSSNLLMGNYINGDRWWLERHP